MFISERVIQMRFLHFLVISCWVLIMTGSIAGAQIDSSASADQNFIQYESLLLEKLNWARSFPNEAAAVAGFDPNQLVLDSPGWRAIVSGGLPLLRSNERLQQTARQHTQDMVTNRYYAYDSPDGKTAEQRISEGGYDAVISGEMLGLVAFSNFMGPEIAVQNLFEQLLKREFRQLDSGKIHIFNSSLQDIGISMMAGVSVIGNATYNAYILTCDFGMPSTSRFGSPDAEFFFLDMMNQVRLAPLQAFEQYGIDLTLLTGLHPAVMEILTNRLPPLVYSPGLRGVALKRNVGVFGDPLFADNPATVFQYDNCTESAIDCPALTGELVAAYKDSQNRLPREVVGMLFRELLIRELQSTDVSTLWILNPNVQEIGITLGHRQVTSGGATDTYYVLTNAFGQDYRSKLEKQALSLLNQERAFYVADTTETDSASLPSALQPIPPLVPDQMMFAAADAHGRDMITLGYFDTYSFDGTQDCADRLSALGYPVLEADETIEMIAHEAPFDPAAAGSALFDSLLATQAPSDQEGSPGLLNPRMKTAGIRFLYTTPVTPDPAAEVPLSSFQKVYSLLMVADVAAPLESTEAVLVGLIFKDLNGDGRYGRDEELVSIPVTIRTGDAAYCFYTDAAGNVAVPLPAGTHTVEVVYDGVLLNQTVEIGTENTMLLFPF